MYEMRFLTVLSFILAAAPAAAAEPAAAPAAEPAAEPAVEAESRDSVSIGARVGVFLPQVSSELGTHVIATLEAGYAFAVWDGRLQLFGSIAYAQPERTESRSDERLSGAEGGVYDFTTIQRELTFDLGLMLRFLPLDSRFNAYAALAPRLYLLETETFGEAGGEKFGTNSEHSTKIGFLFGLGGEVVLGPGRVLLQVSFAYSQLQHEFTGDVPTGALAIAAGYRFMF